MPQERALFMPKSETERILEEQLSLPNIFLQVANNIEKYRAEWGNTIGKNKPPLPTVNEIYAEISKGNIISAFLKELKSKNIPKRLENAKSVEEVKAIQDDFEQLAADLVKKYGVKSTGTNFDDVPSNAQGIRAEAVKVMISKMDDIILGKLLTFD